MDYLPEEFAAEISSPEDSVLEDLYRQTYLRFVNPNMISGHLQGLLLEFISKMISPQTILEIGTFTGYSAICMAKGLRKGGKLITIEINDELSEFTKSYFRKAGVADLIVQKTGNALEIIPELNEKYDLVYIDGDKREYILYFKLVEKHVKPGGFIIADNILWGGKALDKNSRDPQTRGIIEFNEMIAEEKGYEKLLLPFRDGLMLMRKL
jgi:predicted O-methyltransferase YrrM